MAVRWIDDLRFYAHDILSWILTIAIFGLLFLISVKVLKNLPALLNIITL